MATVQTWPNRRPRSYGDVTALAVRLHVQHPQHLWRYRRKLLPPAYEQWEERIALILALPKWAYNTRARDRIARTILKLSAGLEGKVFAVFCNPELLVSNDPAEIVQFATALAGVRTICVSDVLGRIGKDRR